MERGGREIDGGARIGRDAVAVREHALGTSVGAEDWTCETRAAAPSCCSISRGITAKDYIADRPSSFQARRIAQCISILRYVSRVADEYTENPFIRHFFTLSVAADEHH